MVFIVIVVLMYFGRKRMNRSKPYSMIITTTSSDIPIVYLIQLIDNLLLFHSRSLVAAVELTVMLARQDG